MADLKTKYLGLSLKNPLVASSSPLSEDVDALRKMEDAGLAAVVLHSLFEEQIAAERGTLEQDLAKGTESFAESLSYFPELDEYVLGGEEYLELIRSAKESVGIPVIGSLNGTTQGGWLDYAKMIEDAGADALELNIYRIPTDPNRSGADVEQGYVDLVKSVRGAIKIPLAVKLGLHFSSIPNVAKRLADAGADALVLFNRFYQPDIDLESLEVVSNLVPSARQELRQRLHWIAVLCGRVEVDLALTGGVRTSEDVIKAMMVGAKVAMTTCGLLERGIGHATEVIAGITTWMEEKEYESIEQMQGSMSQRSVADPASYERANYLKVLRTPHPEFPMA
jgi:dihydroorotate dehydrogenase (fumarate)